ncbi:MAG: VTT domain-containing protein [Flammeovirgaceae bacterium]|nr:VTT domain-containing protein [Flammeovirgaceae bacterium]
MDKEKKRFIYKALGKGFVSFIFIIFIFIVAKTYINEYLSEVFEPLADKPSLVYSLFFLSETFMGLIPPEFFMIWALEENIFLFIEKVLLLTLISYLGGILAFVTGKTLSNTLLMQKILKSKTARKYLKYYDDYGGFLILISAVTPLPFALISTLSGSLNYSYLKYFKFASVRFVRFGLYGWIIWSINNIS